VVFVYNIDNKIYHLLNMNALLEMVAFKYSRL